MLMSLAAKENDPTTALGYYYTHSQQQHYYCPISINNNSTYQQPVYDTNYSYTRPSDYSQLQRNNETNENSAVYQSVYYSHYLSDRDVDGVPYLQTASNQVASPIQNTNLLPMASNTAQCHRVVNYAPIINEAKDCSMDNCKDNQALYLPSEGICQSDAVIVKLINRPLWLRFSEHTHENIVTKSGRRMFPTLEFKVYGLKPEALYDMYIDMILVDTNHWKFNSGKWIPSGQTEQSQSTSYRYVHPESPKNGLYWMNNEKISFSKLKLTNNKQLIVDGTQDQTVLILNSMRKYMPRLNIIEVNDSSMNSSIQHTFTFPETQFIAVTAYQNTDITQLKIDNNPFAKGFRDSQENRNSFMKYVCNSSSPSCSNESNPTIDYYGNSQESQQSHKKKRRS